VKIQRVIQIVATPRHFMPAALNPEGGGRRISSNPRRVKRSISPRLRNFIFGRKVMSTGTAAEPSPPRCALLFFLSA
jgi:hypothetical protein